MVNPGDQVVTGNLLVVGNQHILGNINVDGTTTAGIISGTVTSVGLIAPAWFNVTNSPITSSGAITLSGSTTGTGSTVLNISPLLTSNSNIITNTPLKLTNTSSSTAGYMNTQLYPNLPILNQMYQSFGRAHSAGSSFVNYFNYNASGDTFNNYLGWSGWGAPENIAMRATGEVAFMSTTPGGIDSTSTITGTFTTAGGAGAQQRITCNGLRIEDPSIAGLGNFSMNGTGDFGVDYPSQIAGRLHLDSTGKLTVGQTIASTSTTTGSIVTPGGVGIGGDVHLGGTVSTGPSNNPFQYSEGTWTPDIHIYNSNSGLLTVSYVPGGQFGQYIKIGKRCTVYFLMVGTIHNTTSTVPIDVVGLPFPMANILSSGVVALNFKLGDVVAYRMPFSLVGNDPGTVRFQVFGVSTTFPPPPPDSVQETRTEAEGVSDLPFTIDCEFTYITQ